MPTHIHTRIMYNKIKHLDWTRNNNEALSIGIALCIVTMWKCNSNLSNKVNYFEYSVIEFSTSLKAYIFYNTETLIYKEKRLESQYTATAL